MIGREVTSAFWKSSSNASLSALSALASPNSSMRKPASRRSSFATVANARVDLGVGLVARQLEGHKGGPAVLGQRALAISSVGALDVANVLRLGRGTTVSTVSGTRIAIPGRGLALYENALAGLVREVVRPTLSARPDSPLPLPD